ncbi:MAG: hypothetical protein EOO87_08320 [Pedobacter sp.]|nr:MAG: hypothetical protein EOO87_08320 [Pedobacter sp.]
MLKQLVALLFFVLMFSVSNAIAQDLKTNVGNNKELDSLRKKAESAEDSVVFDSKYIRYTTRKLTKDSIQTLPIDTGLTGIQNFSIIAQPRNPTVGTGVLGLAARSLLFQPSKTIGFDPGFHSLNYYVLDHDDVKFYRARTAFTNLYYVSGGEKEQVLKLTHSQNINKNLNFGANFNRIGANGDYQNQRGDDLNAAVFTWYQSPNKRYNIWVDGVFNTMKAQENGSLVKDDIFNDANALADKKAENVKLTNARQLWRKNSILIRQSYFVGRIDSTGINSTQNILPTNKINYSLSYTSSAFSFKKDEADSYNALPETTIDAMFTNDSTNVKHVQNEFIYSFFLRAKGNSIIKNELKIDAGIKHDFYKYAQYGFLRDTSTFYSWETSFQNISLLGAVGYRFSNKVDFNLNLQQIFQGEHTGDFMYEAKSNFILSKNIGRIILGAYLQNKSPEQIYNRYYGNYYNWDFRFDRTKTANLSFSYLNDKYKLDATASYYLITNHLYFAADPNKELAIIPVQQSGDISLINVSVGKKFKYNTWHLDAYVVYQKTDNQDVLRTPEFYTFNSLYKEQTFFKRLKTQIGIDVRYHTSFIASSYSAPASQFYNGDNVTFSSKPVIDAWVKVGLRRANLFAKYDYANQGLLSKGIYTVNKYPMPDRLLKLGLSWNFYD